MPLVYKMVMQMEEQIVTLDHMDDVNILILVWHYDALIEVISVN